MLVIDASAATELLLARPSADGVAHHITEHGPDLHAPHLIDIEVMSAVRWLVASGHAPPQRGEEAVADLLDLRWPATRTTSCSHASGNCATTSPRTTRPTSPSPRR